MTPWFHGIIPWHHDTTPWHHGTISWPWYYTMSLRDHTMGFAGPLEMGFFVNSRAAGSRLSSFWLPAPGSRQLTKNPNPIRQDLRRPAEGEDIMTGKANGDVDVPNVM